eukprot:2612638-Pleurochrysis_carterae.AAC.2
MISRARLHDGAAIAHPSASRNQHETLEPPRRVAVSPLALARPRSRARFMRARVATHVHAGHAAGRTACRVAHRVTRSVVRRAAGGREEPCDALGLVVGSRKVESAGVGLDPRLAERDGLQRVASDVGAAVGAEARRVDAHQHAAVPRVRR